MKTDVPYIYDNISLISSYNYISDKHCTENQNTHFVFNNFFPHISVLYMVEK